jgi:hypothetical protein
LGRGDAERVSLGWGRERGDGGRCLSSQAGEEPSCLEVGGTGEQASQFDEVAAALAEGEAVPETANRIDDKGVKSVPAVQGAGTAKLPGIRAEALEETEMFEKSRDRDLLFELFEAQGDREHGGLSGEGVRKRRYGEWTVRKERAEPLMGERWGRERRVFLERADWTGYEARRRQPVWPPEPPDRRNCTGSIPARSVGAALAAQAWREPGRA